MDDADFDRDIRWPLLRMLSRPRRPVYTPPEPDPARKLKDEMDQLADDLTAQRDTAVRDFLSRVQHRYHPGSDGSFIPPCLCGNPVTARLHGPSGTLLETFAWMGRLEAGEVDWRSLPRDLSGVDPALLDADADDGREAQAAVVPCDAGGQDAPLPPGVLGYLVAYADLEAGPGPAGTTHTTLMSLGEASREARAHGVSPRYRWFPAELREAKGD